MSEYYFGGAVANATVEVLVYQNPFYQWWRPRREFAWYYDDIDPRNNLYNQGGGQVVARETLTTDAEGRATLTFETPANGGQDFEYRIEARVTDASRREVIGSGSVRVTRQRYYVYPQPRHHIYRPQDQVEVDFKALDANEQPMRVTGIVKVTRDRWEEIWVDAEGNEISGEELRALQRANPSFPRIGNRVWELKSRGYEQETVLTRSINTNDDGEAEFSFTPQTEGYYSVAFSSEDNADEAPIVAQTAVWVATNSTTELGYRHGGLGIIVDSDTFRVGETAAVMLTAPASDRYVLFSIEGEDLYSYELVHLTGTAKLIEIDLQERHVPNIYLAGTMVADHQIYADVKQVVVPPTRNFLDVEVSADREQYQPGEEGTLTVRVRDHQGRPVAAEVALGLVDESTFYIQSDYAADPRQYFFGRKRPLVVWNGSSFQQKRYADLVEGDEGQLVDRRNELSRQLAVVGGAGEGRVDYDLEATMGNEGFAARSEMSVGQAGGRYMAADAVMPASEAMASAPAPGLAGGPQQPAALEDSVGGIGVGGSGGVAIDEDIEEIALGGAGDRSLARGRDVAGAGGAVCGVGERRNVHLPRPRRHVTVALGGGVDLPGDVAGLGIGRRPDHLKRERALVPALGCGDLHHRPFAGGGIERKAHPVIEAAAIVGVIAAGGIEPRLRRVWQDRRHRDQGDNARRQGCLRVDCLQPVAEIGARHSFRVESDYRHRDGGG